MSNIRVDLDYTIRDGLELKFRSPVDCSAITGLIVYYPGADGNITSKEFVLADAHGNNVGDIDHLFAENVVVKVILDVTTSMAFVQNADTNAYLEAQLASKRPNTWTPTASDVGALPTVGGTMSGALNMGSNNITYLADPTGPMQATNKRYVDNGLGEKADSSHNHDASDITSGTLSTDRLPTVPFEKGGLGGTDRLSSAKNLTNESISSPGYVVSLTGSWANFGYTTLAQLRTAMGVASATPSFSSVTNSTYHYVYFTKIGKLVICTFTQKTLGAEIYGETITIPTGYIPSANKSFKIYSDTAHWQASGSNVSNGGNITVKASTDGKLSINDGGGYNYNTKEIQATICWVTA